MMTQTAIIAIRPVAPFEHAPILALIVVIFASMRLLRQAAEAP